MQPKTSGKKTFPLRDKEEEVDSMNSGAESDHS